MAEIQKVDGRKVGEFSGDADIAIAAAKRILYRVLGEDDPAIYARRIGEALDEIEKGHLAIREIELICRINGVRGPYKK